MAVEKWLFWAEEWMALGSRYSSVWGYSPCTLASGQRKTGDRRHNFTPLIYSFARIQLDTVNLVTSSKSDAEKDIVFIIEAETLQKIMLYFYVFFEATTQQNGNVSL